MRMPNLPPLRDKTDRRGARSASGHVGSPGTSEIIPPWSCPAWDGRERAVAVRSGAPAGAEPSALQGRSHPAPGPVQAAHDGPHRHAERSGCLVVVETVEVDEFGDFSKADRQAPECLVDRRLEGFRQGDGLDPVLRRIRYSLEDGLRFHMLRPVSSQLIQAGVPHDREQPGPRMAAVEALNGLKCSQESLLDEVFRVGVVAGEGAGDPQ
jgi:hypothetical protein